MQALSPHPQRAQGFRLRSEAQASRVGIQRRHHFLPLCSKVLLPMRSNEVVRCSPRLRRCSSATRSAHRRLWPSVQQVGVGHSEPPVKGNRLRSLEPLCPRRVQGPTQKQEVVRKARSAFRDHERPKVSRTTPTSTSEGRVGPSAVDRGSSQLSPAATARGTPGRSRQLDRLSRRPPSRGRSPSR